jgi:hypothetical protein
MNEEVAIATKLSAQEAVRSGETESLEKKTILNGEWR